MDGISAAASAPSIRLYLCHILSPPQQHTRNTRDKNDNTAPEKAKSKDDTALQLHKRYTAPDICQWDKNRGKYQGISTDSFAF